MFSRGRRKAKKKMPLSWETVWKKGSDVIWMIYVRLDVHMDSRSLARWGQRAVNTLIHGENFSIAFFNQLGPPWRSEANMNRVRRGPEERDKILPVSMKLGNQKTWTERRDLPQPTPASFSPYSLAALSSSSFLPLSPPSFTLHELALMKRRTSPRLRFATRGTSAIMEF